MTAPLPRDSAPPMSDAQHKLLDIPADTALKALLQQTVPTAPGAAMDRVEHNALSGWHAHQVRHSLQQAGQVATLGDHGSWLQRHPQLVWLLAATALALAVGLRPTTDPALEDLQHPDVLSQLLIEDL